MQHRELCLAPVHSVTCANISFTVYPPADVQQGHSARFSLTSMKFTCSDGAMVTVALYLRHLGCLGLAKTRLIPGSTSEGHDFQA